MARGKAPESEALKSVVVAFEALSEEDKIFFRNKIFSKICHGLTKEQRDEFKKERLNMLDRIEKAKDVAKQLEAVSNLSIEELEKIIKVKKAKKAK